MESMNGSPGPGPGSGGDDAAPTRAILRSVALRFPDDLRARFAELLRRLDSGARFTGAHPKWLAPGELKLTIAHLGEASGDDAEAMRKACEAACARMPPLRLKFQHLALHPSAKQPKAIGIETRGASRDLPHLRAALADELDGHGMSAAAEAIRSAESWKPVMTLARITSVKGAAALKALLDGHRRYEPGAIVIEAAELIESRPAATGGGRDYVVVAELPFRAVPPPPASGESPEPTVASEDDVSRPAVGIELEDLIVQTK